MIPSLASLYVNRNNQVAWESSFENYAPKSFGSTILPKKCKMAALATCRKRLSTDGAVEARDNTTVFTFTSLIHPNSSPKRRVFAIISSGCGSFEFFFLRFSRIIQASLGEGGPDQIRVRILQRFLLTLLDASAGNLRSGRKKRRGILGTEKRRGAFPCRRRRSECGAFTSATLRSSSEALPPSPRTGPRSPGWPPDP
jgi:hypothetical protein